MKLISIDVGIKNLGCCILTHDSSNNSLKIIEWNIINICNNSPLCSFCKKTAKFKKDNNYYCCMHSKKSNIEKYEINIKELNKKNLKDLKKIAYDKNIIINQNNNKNDILILIKEYINSNFLEELEQISANNINLIDLGINLNNNLNKLFEKIDINTIDIVLIENQISPLANRMKTIQGMIAQYFINKKIYEIKFISACNKLKYFIENKKTSYNERKKIGIDETKKILANNNFNTELDMFLKHSKKDDLADSFLQGIYYFITFNKLILKK